MDRTIKNILKKEYEKGLSLLEALISTAIVGIGFVAVFQIVSYTTSSINVSAERTKMNYIISMVAEDLIGYNSSLVGVNPKTTEIQLDQYRRPIENGVVSTVKKYPQLFIDTEYKIDSCDSNKDRFKKFASNSALYDNDPDKSAAHNKKVRMERIIAQDRYLKCIGASDPGASEDIKSLQVFKICNDTAIGCNHNPGYTDHVYDEVYIGRMQINTNNGKKKKILYFQADYIYRE